MVCMWLYFLFDSGYSTNQPLPGYVIGAPENDFYAIESMDFPAFCWKIVVDSGLLGARCESSG